jgi:hypothetical protein
MCYLTPSLHCNYLKAKADNIFESNQFFFEKHSINTDTHIYMSIYPYQYMYAHLILMSTSEKLSQLDLEIHEVGHQERLIIDRNVASY